MNERQYRDQRQREQDDLDYQEGVDAYHRGWDDRENGRPNLSGEDSTGHYAGGWEAHETDDTAELRDNQARQDEIRRTSVRELVEEL